MKKVMIAIAAMVVTASVQAASVNWQITNVRIPTTTALTITTDSVQFTTANSANLVMNLYVVDAVNGNALIDLEKTGALTANGIQGSSLLWDQATAISMRDAYGHVDGGNTAGTWITLRLVSFYTDGDGVEYTLSVDVSRNLSGIEGAAATYNMAMLNQTWIVVPEPTGMALLALGAAAIGLRRRFRK